MMNFKVTIKRVQNFYTALVNGMCIYVLDGMSDRITGEEVAAARYDMRRNMTFSDGVLFFDGVPVATIWGHQIYEQFGEHVAERVIKPDMLPVYWVGSGVYLLGKDKRLCVYTNIDLTYNADYYFNQDSDGRVYLSDWFNTFEIPVVKTELIHTLPGFTVNGEYVCTPANFKICRVSDLLSEINYRQYGWIMCCNRRDGYVTGTLVAC